MNPLIMFDLEIICARVERWIALQDSIDFMMAGYALIKKCREFHSELHERVSK